VGNPKPPHKKNTLKTTKQITKRKQKTPIQLINAVCTINKSPVDPIGMTDDESNLITQCLSVMLTTNYCCHLKEPVGGGTKSERTSVSVSFYHIGSNTPFVTTGC